MKMKEFRMIYHYAGLNAKRKTCVITTACQNCRKSHLYCDTERPCKRCIDKGWENSCVSSKKRKNRSKLLEEEENSIHFSSSLNHEEKNNEENNKITINNRINKNGNNNGEKNREKNGDGLEKEGLELVISSKSEGVTLSDRSPSDIYPLDLDRSPNKSYSEEILREGTKEGGDESERYKLKYRGDWESDSSSSSSDGDFSPRKIMIVRNTSYFDEFGLDYYLDRISQSSATLFESILRGPGPPIFSVSDDDDLDKVTMAMSKFNIEPTEFQLQFAGVANLLVWLGVSNLQLEQMEVRVKEVKNTHRQLYQNLSAKQRIRVEEEFQEIVQNAIYHASHNATPTCIWDVFGYVHYLNSPLMDLCNYPGEIPSKDQLTFFSLYQFSPEIHMKVNEIWQFKNRSIRLPLTVPMQLQVWGHNPDFILKSRPGPNGVEQYIEGTLMMDVKCNSSGLPMVYFCCFMPNLWSEARINLENNFDST